MFEPCGTADTTKGRPKSHPRSRKGRFEHGWNRTRNLGLHLTQYADQITLLVRGDHLGASRVAQDALARDPKVNVRFHTRVLEFTGAGGKLRSVLVRDSKRNVTEELHPAGVLIFIGLDPNTTFLKGTPVMRDAYGFLVTGDVRAGSTKQVASAAGEGATAALLVRDYLNTV